MTVRFCHGDVRYVLPTLSADSFDCVVTSPPYWCLRDYGVEGQIGLEPTIQEYLDTMVGVMREVKRVIKPEATVWLNIGDSYAANRSYQVSQSKHQSHDFGKSNAQKVPDGLKSKDLCMIPNRLAILLQNDGWYVRSEIIWHKLNPMPESVRDRPTCALAGRGGSHPRSSAPGCCSSLHVAGPGRLFRCNSARLGVTS